MINPLQMTLINNEGEKRYIIIEPVLEKGDKGLRNTGVYKIYKDAFGEESKLITEPLETLAPNNRLPDDINPDYLGKMEFNVYSQWTYHGDLLSLEEQKEAATYIQRY